jgi:hypothetical protein
LGSPELNVRERANQMGIGAYLICTFGPPSII